MHAYNVASAISIKSTLTHCMSHNLAELATCVPSVLWCCESFRYDGRAYNNYYRYWCLYFLQDIRNQHRYRQQRKQELGRLQETLDKLNGKAQFYEEQMKFYQQYVASCLDQLAKASASGKGKGRVRGPGQDAAGFKRQSVKYTAQKLFEKGVILEIEGLPKHQ